MTSRKSLLFLAFLLSGFSGLLYQVVWLRLAFSQFGVITPVLSLVLSVFMLGLGIGSIIAGKLSDRLSAKPRASNLVVYGAIEILIGLWAIAVPILFQVGANTLLPISDTSSTQYMFLSAIAITASILPGCILMGMTFPLVAGYLRNQQNSDTSGFSFLYLANVIGGMCGAALSAHVIIEIFGFRNSLWIGVAFNIVAGLSAFLTQKKYPEPTVVVNNSFEPKTATSNTSTEKLTFFILFLTGFCSMGMEVAWTRAFTPFIRTTIYSFSLLLTTYLFATWVGSYYYRKKLKHGLVVSTEKLLLLAACAAFLPLLFNDPRFKPTMILVSLSIFPVCAVLGYLTPKLVDEYSQGSAKLIGRAYAFNILGCIFGPLFAGYFLLPLIGVKACLFVLALPFVFFVRSLKSAALPVGIAIATALFTITYEDPTNYNDRAEIRRDYTATVISMGEGIHKMLLVNGIGITQLSTVTKVMAHLPLFTLKHQPKAGLAICFGMGTTFRSLRSWGIDTTAVELVPSVRDAFGYYFSDVDQYKNDPGARIIVDDGRRFLRRTQQKFDVITLDPPPPPEAAGSSMLYSKEFYDAAKLRLADHGILQQWFPGGEKKVLKSILESLIVSFKYVRVFRSYGGSWGWHFLASDDPLDMPSVPQALARMKNGARKDLMEWLPEEKIEDLITKILKQEVPISEVLQGEKIPLLTDDRPYNEYYFLRRNRDRANGKYELVD